MSRTRKGESPQGAHADAVWNDLERTLTEALPGFELLDRDLELPNSSSADYVGVDGHGRLTLVLDVGGEGEEPVLRALDALAFARRNADALARHLEAQRVRAELAPRVVLVAEGFSRKLVERMQPLCNHGVDLYELRTLRSKTRTSNWLTPAQASEAVGTAGPASEEAFLASLDAAARESARTLLAKVRRLDPDVEALASRRAITWRHAGQVLGRLELGDGRLYAAAAPRFELRALESAGDVERLLEAMLGRYIEVLSAGRPVSRLGPQRHDAAAVTADGGGASVPLSSAAHAPVLSLSGGGSFGAAPNLTPAEYEAFRHPS